MYFLYTAAFMIEEMRKATSDPYRSHALVHNITMFIMKRYFISFFHPLQRKVVISYLKEEKNDDDDLASAFTPL